MRPRTHTPLRQIPGLALVASLAACASVTAGETPRANPDGLAQLPGHALVPRNAPQEKATAGKAAAPQGQASAAKPAPAPDAAAKSSRGQSPPLLPGLSGWSRTRYRWRSVDGDDDHDLYEVLGLDYVEPSKQRLEAHFLGRAAWDVDGDSGSQLSSINDISSGDVDADVYTAYVQQAFEPADGTRWSVRVGRTEEVLTPEIAHYDGLALDAKLERAKGLEFGAYGGRNVVFDSANGDDGDVVGFHLGARPWKGGRARLDWMHLEDEALLGDDQDDLFGVGLWQAIETWSTSAQYTRVEGRDRDVELRARWNEQGGRTSLALRYFELLEAQNQRALFLDPYLQTLQTYYPYRQFGANVWRALTQKLDADVGFDAREVDDSSDVGTFNHDWRRYYGALTLHELFGKPYTARFEADNYDDDHSDVVAYGGSLTREIGETLDATVGTYYSRYKYDLFTGAEKDDVQTYYAKVVWRQSKTWSFDVLYEYEDDDLDEYHTLRCGALCRF